MRIILLSLYIFLFPFILYSQEDFRLTYLVDSNSTYSYSDVLSKKFEPVDALNTINIGYNIDATVWCKIELTNSDKFQRHLELCFLNNHIDSVQILDDGILSGFLGDRTTQKSPFSSCLSFPVMLDSMEEKLIIARVKKGISFFDFEVAVKTNSELSHNSSKNVFLVAFLTGVALLLIFFNSIICIITKRRVFFLYVFYSILSITYVLITSGLAKYMIFPSFTLMSEARIYISTLWFVALGFFLLELLNLKKYQPFFYYLITVINSIVVLFIPLSMVFLYHDWLSAITFVFVLSYVLFFVSLVAVLVASVLIYKKNKHNASYVVIAFLPHLVWGFSIILVAFRVLETALKLDWIIVISIYEVFVFGYLLTKDYFEAFRMNERLAEDIVKERQTSLVAIETTQIRERRELANYIHDRLGSRLAYISHLVALNNSALLRENIAELSEEIRVISHRILPKSLDEGALYDSIHAHIINLNNGLRDTRITIENYDFPKIINKDWVYTIYLITLEILTNATKHGKPSLISLEFFGYDEELVIQISDNGSGFNTQEVPKGFGLTSAHSRVKEIGGLLELSSASGEGTIVQITLPRMD